MAEPLDIVILGGGTAGWMAAAALVSLLPRERYRVRLVESEEIGIVGVGEATFPEIRYFNEAIGIDEAEMMRATNGAFKLGIEFVDWGFKGSRYIHPFGVHGPAHMEHLFHHQWLRARQAGWESEIGEYSFAAEAARNCRFQFPQTHVSCYPKKGFRLGCSISRWRMRMWSRIFRICTAENFAKIIQVSLRVLSRRRRFISSHSVRP